MAKQTIDVGTAFDDPSATLARPANVMINENFDEIYYFDFVKVKNIGTWNMDSDLSKQVAFEAPTGYIVTGATITIIGDDGKLYPHEIGISSEVTAWQYDYSTEVFTIITGSSGYFNNNNFDGTENNRGYINIHLDRVL